MLSRYRKIYWFRVKKCWCQENLTGVSCDLYIFWIFFRWGITVPSFIIARIFVADFKEEVLFLLPFPISRQPQKDPSWIGLKIRPYLDQGKVLFYKSVIKSQFKYCPLVCMFCSRQSNKLIKFMKGIWG